MDLQLGIKSHTSRHQVSHIPVSSLLSKKPLKRNDALLTHRFPKRKSLLTCSGRFLPSCLPSRAEELGWGMTIGMKKER